MSDRPMTPHDPLSTPAPAAQESAGDLEPILGASEAFIAACGVHFDRHAARSAVAESLASRGESVRRATARGIVDAARAAGLHCRTVRAAAGEVRDIVRDGAPAFAVLGAEGAETICLLELDRREVVRAQAFYGHAAPRPVAWREVERLAREAGDERVEWTLGQATLPFRAIGMAALSGSGRPPSPLRRVAALLALEKNDVLLIAVFALVVGGLALASPLAVEALVNTVAFGQFLQPLFVLSLMLSVFLTLAAVVRLVQVWVVELLQRRFFVRAVEDLAFRLPRVPSFVWRERFGPETANRFFDVASVQKAVATLLLDGIAIVLQTAIGMAVLAFYHPFLLGFDVLLLAAMSVAIFALGAGGIRTAIKESKAKYGVAAWMQELTRHPVAFRSAGGADFAFDRADRLAVDWLHYRGDHFGVVLRQTAFALFLQAAALTALLGLGGYLVIQGDLTLGQLVAAELIIATVVGAFAKFGKQIESFYDLTASIDKIGQLFDLPIERQELRALPSIARPAELAFHRPGLADLREIGGEWEETISGDAPIRIAPGERVAIDGPPGSGKSRLAESLVGLRSPDEGAVRLDGFDVRDVRPHSLLQQATLVRDAEIFAGTIEENLLVASHATYGALRSALADVELAGEIESLPEGLKTVLLTHGAPLSSSQRTRLTLARAIAARPRLLVVDGLLDSLPDDLAERILKRLASPAAPWTLIVITGRRDLLRQFSRILRVGSGPSGAALPAQDASPADRLPVLV